MLMRQFWWFMDPIAACIDKATDSLNRKRDQTTIKKLKEALLRVEHQCNNRKGFMNTIINTTNNMKLLLSDLGMVI